MKRLKFRIKFQLTTKLKVQITKQRKKSKSKNTQRINELTIKKQNMIKSLQKKILKRIK